MKAVSKALLSGVAFVAIASAATPAMAQTPEAQDGATDSATEENVDDNQIVVTAQKREQNIQDVPISIEVVSGEQLEDFHSNDMKAVMNFAPNVFVQTTAGNDVIYIRGFGSPPANFAFDQSVSLYVDGIYAGKSRQAQAPFFDLARVEVLRGPQGALFGKNTAAGAISVVSAGPTDTFEGSMTGLYNFDHKGFEMSGYVSGPLSDTLSARMAFKILKQDGYIYNRATDHDDPETRQQIARGTLKWTPSDKFDFTVKAEYANKVVTGGVTVSSPLTSAQAPTTTRYLDQSALGREGINTESFNTSGTANIYLGDYTLTSITGYSWFNANIVNGFDQTIPGTTNHVTNSVYNSFPERFDQFSQEVRLLSPTGQTVEFIIGAYYDSSTYQLKQLQGFNIAALSYFGRIDSQFDQKAESYSVFGQATANITDAFRAVGSLRYSHSSKDASFFSFLVYGPYALRPVVPVVGGVPVPVVGSNSEGKVDPSLTLQYDVTDDVMVYATYGQGSKSGGFVSNTLGTTATSFQFKPEKSTNYEAGIKATMADGRVVANVSVYNTQFKDLQVSVYQPAISTYLTGNAASATSKGIEGSLKLYLSPNFDISASAAYQDVKYDDYPGAACLASQPTSVCNPAQTDQMQPNHVKNNNLAGYPVAYSSKFTGNVTAHAQFDLSSTMRLDMTGIVAGRSKYFDSDNQSPIFGIQKGYAKVDLRVQLGAQDDSWHIAFVGKNLTNQLTTGSAFNLPSPITSTPRAILYLEPTRNISVEAGFKF